MFQFQLGAIGSEDFIREFKDYVVVSIPAWCDWESIFSGNPSTFPYCFNSSLVRLGADINLTKAIKNGCFNSSLVRLGDYASLDLKLVLSAFQFQLGAIGSELYLLLFK